MMKKLFYSLLFLSSGLTAFTQDDEAGCKDHPLFTRMPGFYLAQCKTEFGDHSFVGAGYKLIGGRTNLTKVEGNKTVLEYKLKEGSTKPSMLQIRRNYGNAMKSVGGTVVMETNEWDQGNADLITLKTTKGGKTIWSQIYIHHFGDGDSYVVTIVEPEAMQQDVAASELLKELNEKGFVNFQINFETNKSQLKEDGMEVVAQIAALLEEDPELRLSIEGHTDNQGTPAKNLTLSRNRAAAVRAALIRMNPAYARRLTTTGWGQTKPLAPNTTEEGRAQNRRVSIVKK